MPLAFCLNLKRAEGISTSGSLHLLCSQTFHGYLFLAHQVPAQMSLLLGPSLTTLLTVVTLPYYDPLCCHQFLFSAQHLPLLKYF